MTTPDDLPSEGTPAVSETPAPKKRGRPRKNPLSEDGVAPVPKKRGRPRKNSLSVEPSSLVDTETATADAYAREEPLPVDDEASAPAGAPIPEPASDLGPSEWSPAVQASDGSVYIPAESTPLPAPEVEEWSPEAAAPSVGAGTPSVGAGTPRTEDTAPEAAMPSVGAGTPRTENPAPEAATPSVGAGTPRTEDTASPAKHKGLVPYPVDADPAVLAAEVKPSEVLKAALAGQHLTRFEMRKLTRRERAYLRAVQHGSTIDYATFVARGIANAQQQIAKGAIPAPPNAKPATSVNAGTPSVGPGTPPIGAGMSSVGAGMPRTSAPAPSLPPLPVVDLQKLDVKLLLERAEQLGLADELPSLQKHDVVYELLRHYARRGGTIIAEGILEIAKDGSGFLRNRYANYHTSPEDAQVPLPLIRRHALRPGDLVIGPCKAPPENAQGKNRHFVLTAVDTVNGLSPALARRITPFENQTPLFPDRRIVLETTPDSVEMRIVDLFTPIGFGQRGLIVAPPRTGKTVIMQKMANAITANYPDAYLIVLLIDERPEEVTDMQRTTKAHVISSTFDEPPEHHVQVADLVIEMARRKVEMGENVVILLDSITRLARAYNTLAPTNGRILSGGVEANALQKPKRFFGSARNLENGGSLTIIATALVETGSRMDEVIFEEFKGTGNMELCLDRALVDKRVFPAINIALSGTRKEDLLVKDPLELQRAWFLRRAFSDAEGIAATAMEELKTRLKKYPTNHDFLMGIQN